MASGDEMKSHPSNRRRTRWWLASGVCLFFFALAAIGLMNPTWPAYDLAKVSPALRAFPTRAERVRSDMLMDGGSRRFGFEYADGRIFQVLALYDDDSVHAQGPERFSKLGVGISASPTWVSSSPDNIGYLGELVRSAKVKVVVPPYPGPEEEFATVSRSDWVAGPRAWVRRILNMCDDCRHRWNAWLVAS